MLGFSFIYSTILFGLIFLYLCDATYQNEAFVANSLSHKSVKLMQIFCFFVLNTKELSSKVLHEMPIYENRMYFGFNDYNNFMI